MIIIIKKEFKMIYNVNCASCGNSLYRNFSKQQQSKSGLYYCNKFCKSIFWNGDKLCSVPKNHKLFQIINKSYQNNRHPEYLTGIYIIKTNPIHISEGYIITANARINGNPRLCGKVPSDMEYIRNCFNGITLYDINSLPEFMEDLTQNWKRIEFKFWNPKDITYVIK